MFGRERQHQRADRLARDVRACVDEQARHRFPGPALALGELVNDAGHRALRVDVDERRGRVERDEGVCCRELLLQGLPRRRVAQVAKRADPEDAPADLARMEEAPRGDLEAERSRNAVQARARLAAHGVLQRVPLFHEVRQVTAGSRGNAGDSPPPARRE